MSQFLDFRLEHVQHLARKRGSSIKCLVIQFNGVRLQFICWQRRKPANRGLGQPMRKRYSKLIHFRSFFSRQKEHGRIFQGQQTALSQTLYVGFQPVPGGHSKRMGTPLEHSQNELKDTQMKPISVHGKNNFSKVVDRSHQCSLKLGQGRISQVRLGQVRFGLV